MIPPQDLQNKKFSHTVRGYNPIEVDDYIKFLLAKYAQLYAENADLEKRLHIVSGKYEELAGDEETIRNAIAQAKKLSSAMVESAQKASDQIADEVKERCDKILKDAEARIAAEKRELNELRAEAAKFRKLLLDEYSRHLSLMKQSAVYLPSDPDAALPSGEDLKGRVYEDLDTEKLMEDAIIAPSRDPELDEFKRFVRPARPQSGDQGSEKAGNARRLSAEIFKVSVDDEELASAPQSADEDANSKNDPHTDAGTDLTKPD